VVYAQNLSSKGVPKMVQQDVETIETLDEDVQQLDVEVTQQADGEVAETLEEEAQQIAIEQGYFEGSIPSDIPPPQVFCRNAPSWRASSNGAVALRRSWNS
jgi:hypothetical protein